MDTSLKDHDVLLLRKKSDNEMFAATMDKHGRTNGISPDETSHPDFLKIDKNGNALENFFENFMRQADDPTRFEFYLVPAVNYAENIEKLREAFQNPDTPENGEFIDLLRIYLQDFLHSHQQSQPPSHQSHQSHPFILPPAIYEPRVDWSQLERIGITRETLEKTGNLDRLLNWQKTDLLPITLKFDDITLRTDARLGLRDLPDGKLALTVHALRKEPELDRYYYGIKFSEGDKQNLLKTGNLGRIAEAEFKKGEKTPVYVSIDKQTNELVSARADRIKIPENIKGVELSDKQRMDLANGKSVLIEGMTSKKGTEFSAHLQFSADKRGFEFRFDNDKKQEQSQREAPKTFRKQELTDDQRSSLKEGKTVHVDGLEDKKGKKYSGYITLNRETGKTDFMFPQNYKAAVSTGKVIPDDRHKTQVAVNSEGKTGEATKHLNEPLKQGQTRPDEKQAEKQNETLKEEKQRRSKGVKV
jgi:hypothetical protein